jgi:hypothetical protein
VRILLPYNHGVLPGTRTFYSHFHLGIEEAARELGHEPVRFEHQDGMVISAAEREALYRLLAEKPCDLVLDLCCWSHALSQLRAWDGSDAGEPIYDAFDCTYAGLLCDQPWFQPVQGMVSSNAWAAVPDQEHPDVIGLIYPQLTLRGTVFAPPAVRTAAINATQTEKSIDVLYAGTLDTTALDRPWHNQPDATLHDDMLAWAQAHPEASLHRALIEIAHSNDITADPGRMQSLLQKVEYCLRTRLRLDAVHAAAASGAALRVIGNGWSKVALPPNVTVQPHIDYEGLLALAAQARICVDASTYRHGANDRVFNYTANGAVCFTNATGYLAGTFATDGDGGGLHSYSTLDLKALGPAIRELLNSPARLREDAERARATTLAKHTWRHRLETLIATVVPQ